MSTPAYQHAAPRQKRTGWLILVMVLSLALAAVACYLLIQQNKLAETSADLKHTSADLTETKASLKATKTQVGDALGDVEHYKAQVTGKDEQLAACALVVEVADHEQSMAMLAMQASSDSSNSYYGAALTKLNRIEDHLDDVQYILDSGGYADTGDLYEDCDPETMVS
jgi:septal ring factor EnvC (AmiA/AmiB activator)